MSDNMNRMNVKSTSRLDNMSRTGFAKSVIAALAMYLTPKIASAKKSDPVVVANENKLELKVPGPISVSAIPLEKIPVSGRYGGTEKVFTGKALVEGDNLDVKIDSAGTERGIPRISVRRNSSEVLLPRKLNDGLDVYYNWTTDVAVARFDLSGVSYFLRFQYTSNKNGIVADVDKNAMIITDVYFVKAGVVVPDTVRQKNAVGLELSDITVACGPDSCEDIASESYEDVIRAQHAVLPIYFETVKEEVKKGISSGQYTKEDLLWYVDEMYNNLETALMADYMSMGVESVDEDSIEFDLYSQMNSYFGDELPAFIEENYRGESPVAEGEITSDELLPSLVDVQPPQQVVPLSSMPADETGVVDEEERDWYNNPLVWVGAGGGAVLVTGAVAGGIVLYKLMNEGEVETLKPQPPINVGRDKWDGHDTANP